jgi:hypothetical protein
MGILIYETTSISHADNIMVLLLLIRHAASSLLFRLCGRSVSHSMLRAAITPDHAAAVDLNFEELELE